MSSDLQRTIADYGDRSLADVADREASAKGWDPGNDDSPYPDDHCQTCGNPVSATLRRVFGDRDNVLHACMDCCDDPQQFKRLASGQSGHWRDDVKLAPRSVGGGR